MSIMPLGFLCTARSAVSVVCVRGLGKVVFPSSVVAYTVHIQAAAIFRNAAMHNMENIHEVFVVDHKTFIVLLL
jgi:hypothetical protein